MSLKNFFFLTGYTPPAETTQGELWGAGHWGFKSGASRLDIAETSYSSPVQIGAGTDWTDAASGSYSSIAIRAGKLYTWGMQDGTYGATGNLGINSTTNVGSPTQVGALTTWKGPISVGYGGKANFAMKTDNTAWAWGTGAGGANGDNSITNRSSPVLVAGGHTWNFVRGGSQTGAGIDSAGRLWTWGTGNFGATAHGDTVHRSSPVQVGSDTDWTDVGIGTNFGGGIRGGKLFMWGKNHNGQLGQGNTTNYSSPKQVGSLTDWKYVFSQSQNGEAHAIKLDGTLWAWGDGANGQLGDGTTVDKSSPVQIGSDTDWGSLSNCGARIVGVKTPSQKMYGWGKNNWGEMGLGHTTNLSAPVQLGAGAQDFKIGPLGHHHFNGSVIFTIKAP